MNSPRIIVTGVHGFVGSRAMAHFKSAVGVSGELLRSPGKALTRLIREQQPELIVNAAAISDIGTCEKNPDASYAANVVLPVVLAKAAREAGAKLISFSSDQVYTGVDGEGPYAEDMALPKPANVYACHKLEAEQRVLDICPDAVLLRATWMYDMPLYGHANRGNFLVNMLGAAARGEKMCFSSAAYRGITYVRQVVELLDSMAALPGGVYNYGSENELNMLETAEALLRVLGLQARIPELLDDSAQKRHNLWMDCGKLRRHGVRFDTTEEGFARCAADYHLR